MTAAQPGGAPDWLDQLATAVMTRIGELIRNVAGGSDEERAAIETTIIAEILARSIETTDTPSVTEITNAVLDVHRLPWRLVSVS